jgi:predicted glycogen debranching enzyme
LIDAARPIAFGRAICGDLEQAERREWLVTNGLGGFASGTIAGTLTRRYHGLLVAALKPPLARTLLATKLDEAVRYRDSVYELAANRWKDDYISPRGFELIERFYLDDGIPVWHYGLADALLEKRIWMAQGANTSFIRYTVLRSAGPLALRLRALVNCRDFHGNTHAGDRSIAVTPRPHGLCIEAYAGATPFWISADGGQWSIENVWYRDFVLAEESRRGLDDRDDNLCAGNLAMTLAQGEILTVTASVAELGSAREAATPVVTTSFSKSAGRPQPWWVTQLERAAEQFIVARPAPGDPDGRSIIAGYHWFGDWGRDTMIALPGLTLATGRGDVALRILTAFAPLVNGGMLPNYLPEPGGTAEYNAADAALWYIEAAGAYLDATGDVTALRALWPSLCDVMTSYRKGTRYGIHMDRDGTIVASAAGVQLTWMDAKIGDWVVTPRAGKPIEIAALWYNALARMSALAALLGEPAEQYVTLAELARVGFERFWNPSTGFCYDVVDGPDGDDPRLRPNQIFAVSLPFSPLTLERQRAVVDVCAAELVTSNGLRTLARSDPRFIPIYGGSPHDRDAAYHQGTVWPWLLGPFAIAYARAYGDRERARSFLAPLADQLLDRGLGSISEVADGTAPFCPNGAIAQAWSVAELLRAWNVLSD